MTSPTPLSTWKSENSLCYSPTDQLTNWLTDGLAGEGARNSYTSKYANGGDYENDDGGCDVNDNDGDDDDDNDDDDDDDNDDDNDDDDDKKIKCECGSAWLACVTRTLPPLTQLWSDADIFIVIIVVW